MSLVYQDIKLYIEGVQVPFNNISIQQGIGVLPSATITIPPFAGLMDIARFYQPKVNVFFLDTKDFQRDSLTEKKYRVLFSGLITATHYAKSKSGSGNISLTFECRHRNSLIQDCLLDFSGFLKNGDTDALGDSNKMTHANSQSAVLEALSGWSHTKLSKSKEDDYSVKNPKGPNAESSTQYLPRELIPYKGRLVGMTGVLINFWNQLNRDAFNEKLMPVSSQFRNLYKPLIEDGLQFFKRLAGHAYLEHPINDRRSKGCSDGGPEFDVMVPPCNRMMVTSAIQANLAVKSIGSTLETSGELTNIYDIFEKFFSAIDYDMLTLSCPAKAIEDPLMDGNREGSLTSAVDTLVRSNLPFYFSPSCNILYPGLYHSLQVSYDEENMPTRVDVSANTMPGDNASFTTHFRSPHSIRASIALKGSIVKTDGVITGENNLFGSIGPSMGALGRFEMGRGVKPKSAWMPEWLSVYGNSTEEAKVSGKEDSKPTEDPRELDIIAKLSKGWEARFGKESSGMNPWSNDSKISAYQRLMIAQADYYYMQAMAGLKAGVVESVFNPYIVPGYPMDIIDSSPSLPSFHALCTNVSHNISSEGNIGTVINFTAAITYSELANYYLPFISPWLQGVLGLAEFPMLTEHKISTESSSAIDIATKYYKPVLGVGAVGPSQLFDFAEGKVLPVKINSVDGGVGPGIEGIENTFKDDIDLIWRPIETQEEFSKSFNLQFIEMSEIIPDTDGAMSTLEIVNPDTARSGAGEKYEIGESAYLDYDLTEFKKINS